LQKLLFALTTSGSSVSLAQIFASIGLPGVLQLSWIFKKS